MELTEPGLRVKNAEKTQQSKRASGEEIRPAVSVIMPVYNGEKYIARAVQSVYAQDVPLELIVIDDGSVDGTREVLIPWENRPDFVYIKNERNLGAAGSRNRGVSVAKGRYVAFLDADDLIEPFYLETLYKALQEHPDASWSYTDLVGFEGQKYIWCKPFSAGRMTFNNTLVNAALFRKKDLEEIDCFPEKWKHYDEDWALYLKLLRAGKHPVHVPIIGFWYRRSNTGMQQTVRKNENLRKQSDDYIADIAKKVDIHIKGEEYEGKLPQEAVKTGFNSKERILAKILSNNLGVKIISSMYRH